MADESRDAADGCWKCLPQHNVTDWTQGKSRVRLGIVLAKVKCSRLRLFNLGEMSCFNRQFNEFEYHFACSRKDVHLCFIMSPGKMIFAVLEL